MIIVDSGVRRSKKYVTYYGNGNTCTRVINTTMSAEQIKDCFPLTPCYEKISNKTKRSY